MLDAEAGRAKSLGEDAATGRVPRLLLDRVRVIGQLQRQYPRNRLLWLEAASTALRAGRPADARQALEEGLAKLAGDPRPRAFGEGAGTL